MPTSDTRTEVLALGTAGRSGASRGHRQARRGWRRQDSGWSARSASSLTGRSGWTWYAAGELVTSSLTWDEVQVRDFGETAIAIGRQTQQATYQGRPADGQFRVTHVFVRDGDRWALASMHLSQAAPPRRPA